MIFSARALMASLNTAAADVAHDLADRLVGHIAFLAVALLKPRNTISTYACTGLEARALGVPEGSLQLNVLIQRVDRQRWSWVDVWTDEGDTVTERCLNIRALGRWIEVYHTPKALQAPVQAV